MSALASVALSAPQGGPGYGNEPASYAYQYGVNDDYSGSKYDAEEKRNGYTTSGSYRVLLPDGRTQTVTYTTADELSGNVVDVTYDGVPTYGAGPNRIGNGGALRQGGPIGSAGLVGRGSPLVQSGRPGLQGRSLLG